jgi:hypothetical protein
LAERLGRFAELTSQVEAARAALRDWTTGDALLVMLYCRAGRFDQARALVPKLLEQLTKDSATTGLGAAGLYADLSVGRVLEGHTATRDLAERVYRHSLTMPLAFTQFRFPPDEIPLHRLVDICVRDGHTEHARAAILDLAHRAVFPENYPELLIKRHRLGGLPVMARALVRLGYPVDAVPLFREALALAELPDIQTGVAAGVVAFAQSQGQVPNDLNRALDGAGRAELAAFAVRQLAEADVHRPDALARDTHQPDAQARGASTPTRSASEGSSSRSGQRTDPPKDQALDLVTLIHPRELDKAAVRSLLAESIAACDAEQLAALAAPLESLRQSHPDDLSVAVVVALHSLASADSSRALAALERLNALVERSPIEPLPPGTRPNARQRTEAARQIPLWLVARACAPASAAQVQSIGERLTARALEAATRQTDTRWLLAMLREQGQRAWDRGDRAGAQAAWARMLNMVVAPEPSRTRRPPPPARTPRPSAAAAQPDGDSR